jgi:hypothetical protein
MAYTTTCQPHGDQLRLRFKSMLGTEDCGDPMESRLPRLGHLAGRPGVAFSTTVRAPKCSAAWSLGESRCGFEVGSGPKTWVVRCGCWWQRHAPAQDCQALFRVLHLCLFQLADSAAACAAPDDRQQLLAMLLYRSGCFEARHSAAGKCW